MRTIVTSLLAAMSIVFGCVLVASCGRPTGGRSLDDLNYFGERPYVTGGADQYRLCWKFGNMGFFFQPSSHVVSGKLLFTLHGTSSSGVLTGRYASVPIARADALEALHGNGAFWLEPDGTEVKLDVRSARDCPEPSSPLHAP
jgi:hypothetical protein